MAAGLPAAAARPPVWAFPPSQNASQPLRDVFAQPDAWAVARSRIDGIGAADHTLAKDFSDADLRAMFAQVKAWRLKFGLEVGALKIWGPTGALAFKAGRPLWNRFIANGATIDSIGMDEPLRVSDRVLHQTPAYAVAETANFIALVRQAYPGTAIGDIEPYPGENQAELLRFIDALQARLRQMHVRGLDFFRLDVDWMHFRNGSFPSGWAGVTRLETAIHQRGLKFSLIYWAADVPSLRRQGRATEQSWEDGIIDQGAEYRAVGGVPDDYVIESWVDAPTQSVPESQPGTFMRSVIDFTEQFVPGDR